MRKRFEMLSRRRITFLCTIIIILNATSIGLTQLHISLSTLIAKTTAPQSSMPAPNNPSKEYIYAGDRLIATEETSGGTPTVSAPSSLSASTALSSQINLTWVPSTSQGITYQVERCQNFGQNCYTTIASGLTNASYTDIAGGSSVVSYLYRVCAIDGSGNHSPYTNVDLATTILFTDDPLGDPKTGGTVIRARHVLELQSAVNAVRLLSGLASFNWSVAPPQTGGTIYAKHIQDLRINLDEALGKLNIPVMPYTDSVTPGVVVKRVHIEEIRQRVK